MFCYYLIFIPIELVLLMNPLKNKIQGSYFRFFCRNFFHILLFLISFQTIIFAEKLPLKLYTSNDGLASSAVLSVFRDSNGFLWFSTRDGLSRFDGREFTNFTISSNSASLTFWTILETKDGYFWISTSDGLYRFKPSQNLQIKPAEYSYKSNESVKLKAEKISDIRPTVLFEDSKGRLWGGSGDLFLIAEKEQIVNQKIDLGKEVIGSRDTPNVLSITESADGSLWFAVIKGVVRLLPDKRNILYPIQTSSDYEGSQSIQIDRQNRIWVVHNGSLFIFLPDSFDQIKDLPNFGKRELNLKQENLKTIGKISFPSKTGELFRFDPFQNEKNQTSPINGMFQSSDGNIWATAREDIYVFNQENYQRLRDTSGLPAWKGSIAEDLNGNLWIGTGGVLRYTRNGLTSFSTSDGLVEANVRNILEDGNGKIHFVHGDNWRISRVTETGLESTKLNLPPSTQILWTSNGAFLDEQNNWWALAETGLYYFAANPVFSAFNNQNPAKVYKTEDGLKGNSLYCAFKDSNGNIWFSVRESSDLSGLTRYDPKTKEFYTFSEKDGYPRGKSPVSFTEDKNGNLWFGFYEGGLAKYSNKHFTDFSEAKGLPKRGIFGLYADEKGRLWISSSESGVARVDEPSADKLTFVPYTTEEGLISNNVRTLISDSQGNIYAGTVRGISRISPESGNIRHLTTADGLAADFVTTSFRDSKGTLWFGTSDGVSKYDPEPKIEPSYSPEIWISKLNIAGTNYEVSEFGQKEIAEITVDSGKNNLQISFLSVGSANRYQYKLEGTEKDEWSDLSSQRTVDFANLAPNSYRFVVRAVNEYGQLSQVPAVVSFKILPPFWKTWWFIGLAVLVISAGVFALDRYRVHKTRQVETAYHELQKSELEKSQAESALQKSREERLAELERVRTRIANDLHDDIGSSLTQIAVLSSVAKETEKDSSELDKSLENISDISNELVEVMSDVVWAINPRKDNLRDLVQRMRRFAADIFTAKDIKFQFAAPDVETNIQVGANIRREIFSIFKESVNNVVKHSECKNAKIEFRIENERIVLQITDNGKGFDVSEFFNESLHYSKGGNGLLNIQRRAEDLGGNCEISSGIGKGTIIRLIIPLDPRDDSDDIHTSQVVGETKKDIG